MPDSSIPYNSSFHISKVIGNNAFSYNKRKNPQLFVSSLIAGSVEDLQIGDETVFEDYDEKGILQSCVGLKNFIEFNWNGIQTIVFDNHNHAFYFWFRAFTQGIIKKNATLIHVDQHKDTRLPKENFRGKTLTEAFLYTNKVLNVGNYIVPAKEYGIIDEIEFIMGESDLGKKRYIKTQNKILNIDLDFFAPEMSYIDFNKSKKYILEHLKTANLVTIATSPFFIDQNRALKYLHLLTE